MTSLRPVCFALVATSLLAAAGCRTAGVGNLARQPTRCPPAPRRAPPTCSSSTTATPSGSRAWRPSPTISSANRGADRRPERQARAGAAPQLQARPVRADPRGRRHRLERRGVLVLGQGLPGEGRLLLQLRRDRRQPARRRRPPARLDHRGAGLRVISDEEAARIKVTPGKDPGTLVLTERQKTARASRSSRKRSSTRRPAGSASTGSTRADRKTPLAHAVVTDYQEYPLPAETGRRAEKVYLPAEAPAGVDAAGEDGARRDPEQASRSTRSSRRAPAGPVRRAEARRATPGSTWTGPGWPRHPRRRRRPDRRSARRCPPRRPGSGSSEPDPARARRRRRSPAATRPRSPPTSPAAYAAGSRRSSARRSRRSPTRAPVRRGPVGLAGLDSAARASNASSA